VSSSVPTVKRLVELDGVLRGRRAVVIGNGESRLACDLLALAPGVVSFGCNALYRDFIPHYLGSVDELMTDEIVRSYNGESYSFIGFYSRVQQWLRAERHPTELIYIDSESDPTTGPMMLGAAARLGCDPVYLLGFDVGWTPRAGRVNSVYRDTPLYASSADALSCHVALWQRQIARVIGTFPQTSFRQVGPPTLRLSNAQREEVFR
jgi:hypothetical protein